jgi:signal transduction histidine kinase
MMKTRMQHGLGLAALLVPVLAIGLVDWLSGPRISLALFYAIPITLAGWFLGGWAAFWTAAAAGIGIYLGDVAQQGGALTLTVGWNATVRLVFLIAVGQFTARVRRDREKLRGLLNRETTARIATVEQLRHRDRLAMVGQISSGIAHEIGTPLNVIAGRARLITEPDATLDETRTHAVAILEQSERVASIIRQLLDFARRRGPQRDQTNLLDLAARVLGMLRPLASKRQVELILDEHSVPATAPFDAMQIEQALGNLVLNAIQAITEEGRVRVAVCKIHKAAPAELGGRSGEYAVLKVEDNGTGIAKENIAQIFEPFFTTHSAGEGTGLGLSITTEIIRDHGGWIEVESEQWKGSLFTVFLPMSPQVEKPTPR